DGPDSPADLEIAECADRPGAEHRADEERGQERHRRPERDVAEDVEGDVVLGESGQRRQHRAGPPPSRARSASTARSIRIPRAPLTSTRSPGPTRAATWAAASSGVRQAATSPQPAAAASATVM